MRGHVRARRIRGFLKSRGMHSGGCGACSRSDVFVRPRLPPVVRTCIHKERHARSSTAWHGFYSPASLNSAHRRAHAGSGGESLGEHLETITAPSPAATPSPDIPRVFLAFSSFSCLLILFYIHPALLIYVRLTLDSLLRALSPFLSSHMSSPKLRVAIWYHLSSNLLPS